MYVSNLLLIRRADVDHSVDTDREGQHRSQLSVQGAVGWYFAKTSFTLWSVKLRLVGVKTQLGLGEASRRWMATSSTPVRSTSSPLQWAGFILGVAGCP